MVALAVAAVWGLTYSQPEVVGCKIPDKVIRGVPRIQISIPVGQRLAVAVLVEKGKA
jgi:hypothetical protein